MQAIDLVAANLTNSYLSYAQMQGADLAGAKLMNTRLSNAEMQGVNLMDADLTDADLSDAEMQAACFYDAEIQKARFDNTKIQGADFENRRFGVYFESLIEKFTYKKDNFSMLHFDDITDKERMLKGIVRGHYTEEKAEEWITEYKKAMAAF